MGEVETAKIKRVTAGFVFSLLGGGFNFFFGISFLMSSITSHPQSWWGQILFSSENLVPSWPTGREPSTLGAIVAFCGIMVIVGAILIYIPGKEAIGGTLVIALSIVCFIILPITVFFDFVGVFGGALGLAKKRSQTSRPFSLFF